MNRSAVIPVAVAFPNTSSPTIWRWRRKKWLETTNISGRLYCTEEAIAEFKRRAAAGEFAQNHKVPSRKADR